VEILTESGAKVGARKSEKVGLCPFPMYNYHPVPVKCFSGRKRRLCAQTETKEKLEKRGQFQQRAFS
jgi:hypothetical protein